MFLLFYSNVVRFKLIFVLLLSVFVLKLSDVHAQNSEKFGETAEPEYRFGFNLLETANGALFHLALVKTDIEGRKEVKQITFDDFLYQASGKVESVANTKSVNYFVKYGITKPVETLRMLWKLRFKEMPQGGSNEEGWAHYASDAFFVLSNEQREVLRKYGMKRMTDFIVGDNAFKLLRNMEDATWVEQYKSGNAPGPN